MNQNFSQLLLDGEGGIAKDGSGTDPSWTHLNFESSQGIEWIKKQANISDHSMELLLSGDTRPRCLIDDDGSINLCLRGINLNPNSSPEDMISLRLWLKGNTFISCNRRESQSINRLYDKLNKRQGPKTADELLLGLIEELASISESFMETLESELDLQEDQIAMAKFEVFNPKMSRLRRQIATIKRFLTPQKEALERLYRTKNSSFSEHFYESLYVQLDKFILMLENMDLLRERIIVLQEQFMGYISHEQNSRLYLLAIISAIFLPLTFLSGLLGMNVGGLPGLENTNAFWIVSGFCLVVAVGLLIWFKRKKWF
ncbi:MAG: zinc transporter ZntB [Gammaproteobacteria bacterium]|nr:zinc transporter ZntB [Gammaproteobacteria bacterium]